ncbi:MAG: 50S ribosomal protein L29 [Deltaproteobacteria bacterium]|nr:50S ribosomal protein L29 [Deltaproteobacteria bacterium]MBW1955709.1 50S ribosomal protein L29 [Deltaproteobacteria bacterium]MBW2041403.1 50S ribosomal protein L29 [Deltaproteobacteria bacterium]MBW2133077.1 50S ribosomal protein L29 [Deltaproteobacteria bacterium]
MKASEIRELTPEERQRKLTELTEALFNLRFQHEIGQLENPKRIQQTRRDIARIRTVIREASSTETKEKPA